MKERKNGERTTKYANSFRYTLQKATKQHFNLLIFHYALFPDGVEEKENVLSLFMRARKIVCLHKALKRGALHNLHQIERDPVEQKLLAAERDKSTGEIFNFLHIKIQSNSNSTDGKNIRYDLSLSTFDFSRGKFSAALAIF